MRIGKGYDRQNKIEKQREALGDIQGNEFMPLTRRINNVNIDAISSTAKTLVNKELSELRNSLSNFTSEPGLYSPFSFILHLNAERLEEDPKKLCTILEILLSDRGFIFDEVRPPANGQYSLGERADILAPNKEKCESSKAVSYPALSWSESEMIDEAIMRLSLSYNDVDGSLLKTFDEIAQVESANKPEGEVFRRYARARFNMVARHRPDIDQLYPKEVLDKPVYRFYDTDKAVLLDELTPEMMDNLRWDNDKPAEYTLRQAFVRLDEICNKMEQEYKSAFKKIDSSIIGKEAYKRYRELKKAQNKIKDEFELFKKAKPFIQERIEEWNACPNGADVGLSKERDKRSVLKRQRVYFYFNNTPDQDLHIEHLTSRVQEAFTQYTNGILAESEPTLGRLSQNLTRIICFSLWDMFAIFDDDDNDNKKVTFAPIITFLVLAKHTKQVLNGHLNAILPNEFTAHAYNPGSLQRLSRDCLLFDSLVQAYAEFYREQYSENVKKVWHAAFHYYVDCRWVSFAEMKKVPFLPSLFSFQSIDICTQSNIAVDFIHSPVQKNDAMKQERAAAFRPKSANDPGWNAVQYFDGLLSKKDYASDYLELLLRHPSDTIIRSNLYRNLDEMLTTTIDGSSFRCDSDYYSAKLCDLELLKCFPLYIWRKSSRKDALCIALEYAIRRRLAIDCAERLYRWYVIVLDDLLSQDINYDDQTT